MILFLEPFFIENKEFLLCIQPLWVYKMSYRRDNNRYPREMHKIICAECGKEAEVPFKPDGVRPVYCQECYRKRRPQRY